MRDHLYIPYWYNRKNSLRRWLWIFSPAAEHSKFTLIDGHRNTTGETHPNKVVVLKSSRSSGLDLYSVGAANSSLRPCLSEAYDHRWWVHIDSHSCGRRVEIWGWSFVCPLPPPNYNTLPHTMCFPPQKTTT